MNDDEALEMMNRCKSEIVRQQGVIAHLEPKAEAYDNIATILGLLPRPGGLMGHDLVWQLNKRIQELTAALVAPSTPSKDA